MNLFKVLVASAAFGACATADHHSKPNLRKVQDVQPALTKSPTGEEPFFPANWTAPAVDSTAGGCDWAAYKQCDSRWANDELGTSSNTICSAGCAMSSLAMYLTTRGHEFTPHSLNEWLKGNSGYASGDLLVWSAADKLGLSYQGQEHDVSVDVLTAGLEKCHGIIANVRDGSHWVLLTSHAGGDSFNVHDPGFNQATYTTSEMGAISVYH